MQPEEPAIKDTVVPTTVDGSGSGMSRPLQAKAHVAHLGDGSENMARKGQGAVIGAPDEGRWRDHCYIWCLMSIGWHVRRPQL